MNELNLPAFHLSFPDVQDFNEMNVEGLFWDSKELNDLNKTLITTTLQLRKINTTINKYERAKTKAQLRYKHKYREELFAAEGKNETQKKLVAELACEELEMKVAYLEEVISELTRNAYTLRAELDTLKTIGLNVRQEMRI